MRSDKNGHRSSRNSAPTSACPGKVDTDFPKRTCANERREDAMRVLRLAVALAGAVAMAASTALPSAAQTFPAGPGTLTVIPDSTVTANPSLFTKLSYDPDRDLTPITPLCRITPVLVINAAVPAQNVKELV